MVRLIVEQVYGLVMSYSYSYSYSRHIMQLYSYFCSFRGDVSIMIYTSRLRRPSGPLKYRTYAPDRNCGQTNRQIYSVSQSRINIVGYTSVS